MDINVDCQGPFQTKIQLIKTYWRGVIAVRAHDSCAEGLRF